MTHDTLLEQNIFNMYMEISLGNNEHGSSCKQEIPNLKGPISIWGIGDEYQNAIPKILFVGAVGHIVAMLKKLPTKYILWRGLMRLLIRI